MRIARIEKSKHKQERVLVFLEDETLLRVTGAELLRFGLYKGMDVPPELVVELQAAAQQSQVEEAAARTGVGRDPGRMHSKQEVQRLLTKKGAPEDEAAETADWLEGLGAVNDEAYAGVIARHYGTLGYGPARVKQELHRRGIPKELWDGALAQLPPAQDTIRALAHAKLRGKSLDTDTSRRLVAYLQRRGFSWNDIRPVLNELGQDIDEE